MMQKIYLLIIMMAFKGLFSSEDNNKIEKLEKNVEEILKLGEGGVKKIYKHSINSYNILIGNNYEQDFGKNLKNGLKELLGKAIEGYNFYIESYDKLLVDNNLKEIHLKKLLLGQNISLFIMLFGYKKIALFSYFCNLFYVLQSNKNIR